MTKVCKDVGWDGKGFYCLRCGKAGFKSEASARGHLSQCKGRAIGRGVPAIEMGALQSSVEQAVVAPVSVGDNGGTYPLFSGGGGAPGGGQSTTFLPDIVQVSSGWYGNVDSRLKTLENEYNHLLIEKNQPSQYHPVKQDFFNQYKSVIIIGAIVLFAIMLSKQSGQCQSESGSTSMGNIGSKALSKLVDAGISKGVSALFK